MRGHIGGGGIKRGAGERQANKQESGGEGTHGSEVMRGHIGGDKGGGWREGDRGVDIGQPGGDRVKIDREVLREGEEERGEKERGERRKERRRETEWEYNQGGDMV